MCDSGVYICMVANYGVLILVCRLHKMFGHFVLHLYGFIDRTASEDRKLDERGVMTHSKGPQARNRTRGHCSKDT